MICDEAHTALGEKTSACIRAWTGPVFIGMTATGALIARHVADLFPTQTSRFDLAQAARRGVIAPLRCIRIPPGPGVRTIAKVPLRKGEVDQDFDQEELAKLLDQTPFNVAIADLYRSRFRNVPGVVYTAGVKHANNVAKAFQDAGINARAVSGETPKRELAEILAGFERGEVDVLCNAMLLAEGWNSPRATICMHLAPTASRRVYQQRVGRVTRRNPGKEAGLVIDFVHPATTHDETIVTLHSLLDRDVYRGGAIVVGPGSPRPRPPGARREARGAGLRRREPPPAGPRARALADRGREPQPLRAARLGRARRRPRQPVGLAAGEGDAPARQHQGAAPPLPAHLHPAQPQLPAPHQGAQPRSPPCATPRPSTTRSTPSAPGRATTAGPGPGSCSRRSPSAGSAAATRPRPGSGASPSYTRDLHEEYAVQRWPETKRLLGLLVNSSGRAHGRNARRLVHAARNQDRRLAAALLAAAVAHTPEGEEVLRGARMRAARKPSGVARELLRNFPKAGTRRRRRKRKGQGGDGAAGRNGRNGAKPRARADAAERGEARSGERSRAG